jgi:hypothetical protein
MKACRPWLRPFSETETERIERVGIPYLCMFCILCVVACYRTADTGKSDRSQTTAKASRSALLVQNDRSFWIVRVPFSFYCFFGSKGFVASWAVF